MVLTICHSGDVAVLCCRTEIYIHCHKNNKNLRIKTKLDMVEADATVYSMSSFLDIYSIYVQYIQKTNILRSIGSSGDRLDLFAEIQIIFRTVYLEESEVRAKY